MTAYNDNLTTQLQSLASSTRNHMKFVESIVETSNLPSNVQELATGRTLMWATQNAPYASNEYLQFFAFASMQGSLQLLQTELNLALSDDWRSTRQMVWEGVKYALDNPTPASPLAELKEQYQSTRNRAALSTFEPGEDTITLDMTAENLDAVLRNEYCQKLSYAQANFWLAHRIMLSASVDDANQAVKLYQADFSDYITKKLPVYTPRSLQIAKQDGIDGLYQKLSVHLKKVSSAKLNVIGDGMPEELFDTLDTLGAFERKSPAASEANNAGPAELIQAIADKFSMPIISMEKWKAEGKKRDAPVIVRNFDFRATGHATLGRAMYVMVGPKEAEDIRIELKNQTVSGSASDKLAMSVYRLEKMSQSAPYAKTIVGVANTTYFNDDTLDVAKEFIKDPKKMIFAIKKQVAKQLLVAAEEMMKHYVKNSLEPTKAQEVLNDILGLDEPDHSVHTNNPINVTDEEFGMG